MGQEQLDEIIMSVLAKEKRKFVNSVLTSGGQVYRLDLLFAGELEEGKVRKSK